MEADRPVVWAWWEGAHLLAAAAILAAPQSNSSGRLQYFSKLTVRDGIKLIPPPRSSEPHLLPSVKTHPPSTPETRPLLLAKPAATMSFGGQAPTIVVLKEGWLPRHTSPSNAAEASRADKPPDF